MRWSPGPSALARRWPLSRPSSVERVFTRTAIRDDHGVDLAIYPVHAEAFSWYLRPRAGLRAQWICRAGNLGVGNQSDAGDVELLDGRADLRCSASRPEPCRMHLGSSGYQDCYRDAEAGGCR